MKQNSDGGFPCTLVGENESPLGLFASDGTIRVTTDSGFGLYAPNGSLRITLSTSTSLYSPNGNYNGLIQNGALYIPPHNQDIDLEPPPESPTLLTPASITAPDGFVVGASLTGVPATFDGATSVTSWWALGVPGDINPYWRPYTGNETIDCPPWPDEEIYFWSEAVNGVSTPVISQSSTHVIEEAPPELITQTFWTTGDTPTQQNNDEGTFLTVGMRITPAVNGQFTKIGFWRTASDVATSRTVGVYSDSGTLLASGTSVAESGTGWKWADLSAPLDVVAGTTYRIAAHHPRYFGRTLNYFDAGAVTRDMLTAPQATNGVYGGNGVGTITFPNTTNIGSNYYVDVEFVHEDTDPPDPPPLGDFPDATNTGTSGTLTPMSGGNLSGLIENRDISGNSTIVANGTTLRNCRIRASGMYHTLVIAAGVSGVTIEDCEIDGMNGTAKTGLYAAGTDNSFVIRRCNIHGVENAIDYNNNGTIEDNYIWGFAGAPGAHFDGIEANGGSNIIVRHNTVWINSTQTSGIMLNNYFRGMSNVLVENNKIVGGNTMGEIGAVAGSYPIYCDNSFSGGPIDGSTVIIRNNTMQNGSAGPVAYMALYSSGAQHYGNTDYETGNPID